MRLQPRYSWLPTPYRSVLLFLVWLLLNQSVAPVHLFFGFVLALLIPWISAKFRDPQPLIERPILALRYILMVLMDIVTANAQVAILILGPTKRLKPAFVRVPLDLQHELPITILASTVSMTPGTVSADIYPTKEMLAEGEEVKQRWLLIHVLNLEDEAELIASIKSRYEAPLKEIFQC
ncbi:Na+/H+ antiporter subunit E [Alishewanella sp. 16-MA]|uniref:Na+/H+ antiporter subunit E n=1 Tax=Alishewanella maricola TaxID=2795740 RepID=A0ABS8BYV4_9ALTE|nr:MULTISPECIES: Na+/H+ antiporter subunit E [Gammaproteobacteria]MDP4944381.1 Na+/H+ antiporter subunit E [Alishewanella sp.]MDP5205674.1 Na+/H+ antiporter subunit E [Alishewanella sp. SMS9]MCB5225251.1 Na+/H+ antiporter subunit E [Alishewanella maricola]MCF4008500.1 Na+/H+ antiporter subunit E [Rheinheimera sp. UJ63]MDP5036302.1 Na+/H+ antiporter subunit E [Alishewanella sp.]